MLVEWLAPAAAIALGARLLWMGGKLGWSVDNVLRTGGTMVLACYLVRTSLGVRHSIAASVVFSTLMLTLAVIPARAVLRLIRAKRPNEIEDPEMFAYGELKPGAESLPPRGPNRD
jgi:Kef-type K+ transport system membrane component KefB